MLKVCIIHHRECPKNKEGCQIKTIPCPDCARSQRNEEVAVKRAMTLQKAIVDALTKRRYIDAKKILKKAIGRK